MELLNIAMFVGGVGLTWFGGYKLGHIQGRTNGIRDTSPRTPLPAAVTTKMVTAALEGLSDIFRGDAGQIGINQPRANWRAAMGNALQAGIRADQPTPKEGE